MKKKKLLTLMKCASIVNILVPYYSYQRVGVVKNEANTAPIKTKNNLVRSKRRIRA